MRHLYVHVPFCPTICPFCDFHVLERRSGQVTQYLAELDREAAGLTARGDIGPLDTVYLGGGTPSHLRTAELTDLIAMLCRRFGRPGLPLAPEITLEVHPSTVTAERAAAWVDLGVTRLSVGVQSFDDAVLSTLGRPHDASTARAAVDLCRATGALVSVDLITAVAGQDLDAELDEVIGLAPDHVSAYTLTIEPGTPFDRDGFEVDDDVARYALVRTAERLSSAGFERYEVSNYARPGARSRHNQAYWANRWFAGIGPSAASHLPFRAGQFISERHANPRWEEWLAGGRGRPDPRRAADLLTDGLLCGVRHRDGAELDVLAAQTGLDAELVLGAEISSLVADGLLEPVDSEGPRRLRATDAGVLVLDRVTAALL